MKKILVIGGRGLLGSALMERGQSEFEIIGTTNKTLEPNYAKLEVRDRYSVFKLVNKIRPDIVIDTHTVHTDFCETHKEEAWEINVSGTRNVVEAAADVGAKYIFISSEDIFDGTKPKYYETDEPKPINYYGKTKAIAERVVTTLNSNFIIVRSSFLYGPKSSTGKKSFLFFIIEQLRKEKRIDVMTDEFGSPTFSYNLADVILKLCKLNARGIFHVVGSDNISKYEFAKLIARNFSLNESLIRPTTRNNIIKTAPRAQRIILDTTKVKSIAKIKLLGANEGLSKLSKTGV